MLKVHYPLGTSGTKFVFRDTDTGKHAFVSYSTAMGTPEIGIYKCDGLGNVHDWGEVYGERSGDLTPADIFKVVERFNNDPRTTVWGLKQCLRR